MKKVNFKDVFALLVFTVAFLLLGTTASMAQANVLTKQEAYSANNGTNNGTNNGPYNKEFVSVTVAQKALLLALETFNLELKGLTIGTPAYNCKLVEIQSYKVALRNLEQGKSVEAAYAGGSTQFESASLADASNATQLKAAHKNFYNLLTTP